ncbi:MAG: hypothetical protein KAW16_04285, partial [candidate division Zixibacteria bacterium]|nr:hypothetical protein [candidate division Zixibacteria bacterium]
NEYRSSYCKAKVQEHEYLDGRINISYQGTRLRHQPISKEKIKSFPPVIEEKKDELVNINY